MLSTTMGSAFCYWFVIDIFAEKMALILTLLHAI